MKEESQVQHQHHCVHFLNTVTAAMLTNDCHVCFASLRLSPDAEIRREAIDKLEKAEKAGLFRAPLRIESEVATARRVLVVQTMTFVTEKNHRHHLQQHQPQHQHHHS